MAIGTSNRVSTQSVGFLALVTAQMLTAFNDNAFRACIVLLAFRFYPGGKDSAFASLAMGLFLLPYALFSLVAGAASDRFSKKSVIVFWKILEIPMVLIGVASLTSASADATGAFTLMLIMLTCLGLQTAFISPARYGILPEILDDLDLSHGNGNLEFGNYMGILAGTIAGGFIVDGLFSPNVSTGHWIIAAAVMPVASFVGVAASVLIPRVSAANPQQSIITHVNPMLFVENWKTLRGHKGLVPTVFGLTVFWGVSTLFMLNAPAFGKAYLGYGSDPTGYSMLLVAISVGVGLGSWIAGRLSKGTIELGLAPIGSFFWFVAAMGLTMTGAFGTTNYDVNGQSIVGEYRWPAMLLLGLGGMSAGMYVVPLNAFLEKYSPADQRASCIATSNIVNVLGMIGACLINFMLASVMGFSPKVVFLAGGLILAVATYYVFSLLPDFFIRFCVMVLTRLLYRVEVHGIENVPARGPALLVCNHLSYMDGSLIVATFHRMVRFVVYRGIYEAKFLRWMATTMQAIPIDSEAPAKEIVKSLRRATEALSAGELVCVFAEGGLSRTGFMLRFHRGFELILKRAPDVPIIPVYIDGMWGSIFSFHRGKFFWKRPEKFPYPVTIKFGKPMPNNSTAMDVREQVQILGAECFELRRSRNLPLHFQFIHMAKRFAKRPAFVDSNTPMLSFGDALIRSVVLRQIFSRKLGKEQFVGLLVPPSVAGALSNFALAYLGKVAVNLNYTVGQDVLDRCIAQCGITQVITSRKFMEKIELRPKTEIIYLEDLKTEARTADKVLGVLVRFLPSFVGIHWLLKMGGHSVDDLATIIFSSGSTGDPKGVMLTHHNIVSNIESVRQVIDATEEDGIMGVLPFFHSFGYTGTLWLFALVGGKSVYHFTPLDAEMVGKLIREHKPTIFISTATFLRGYIRKCEPEDLKSLRLVICGAEKLPMQVADQFEKKFGFRPMEGYGCTELSPAVSTNRPDYVRESYRQIGNKPGTIGHPMPGIAVRIADPETIEPLPLGSEGLLLVKGPNVMKGYLNKPELTALAIKDGWYITGDIAKLDEDGFVTITDRISRFSKIGGEMVPHGKVEDALHEILGTTDRIFAVVGVPDQRKGERLIVIHTPLSISINELWEKLRESGIPPIWTPAKNAFIQIDEMPILGTGKLDLKRIKAIAHEHLDTAQAG